MKKLSAYIAMFFYSLTSVAATFDTYLDDVSGYQAAAGSLSRLYFENFSSVTSNSPITGTTNWNGFQIGLYNGGSNAWGGSSYTTSLQGSIGWNPSAPNLPGVYAAVGNNGVTGTGISFTPLTNTIAGMSFDFVDWNDGGQRSVFVITASDGSSIVVAGPTNISGAPPQNFGVKLSAADIAANRYITGIHWYGLPNNAEVVGFWNFSLFTNANLDSCAVNDPNCVSVSQLFSLLGLGPSTADTQSSLHLLVPKLRSGFTQQITATNFANMNTYDCDLFDTKGVCVSLGGQQTYVDQPSSNYTASVVSAGYRISPTLRIGGFINQHLNNHTDANVDISNSTPLMGLFAVWNQNEDHLGYQVKIANAYEDKDVRTLREVVGTSEAGKGKTNLNTQSYVGEVSYAFLANEDKTLVRPYAALRYTRIKQDGYTEDSSVTSPLTYASLEDRSTSALVGVKVDHKLADNFHAKASLGIEQDLYHHVDKLTATGVSGLTSENFNDNIKRTRPVASIGAYSTPAKNQRIAADVYYQQLPFQSTGSTTAYVNYMIGF